MMEFWDTLMAVDGPSGKFIRMISNVEQSAFGRTVHRKHSFGTVK